MKIGVISDTHGLLRPEAERALERVGMIVHAGDVGDPTVLVGLKKIAPVFAVRGNVDIGAWAEELPLRAVVEANSSRFCIVHNLRELDLVPEQAGFDVVISGHTHRVETRERGRVWYLNPGSAGPRRFHLPVTLLIMERARPGWKIEIVELKRGESGLRRLPTQRGNAQSGN